MYEIKRLGKRLLYLVGGILIVFISAIILAVYIEGGGDWISQGTLVLILAIGSGIGKFIASVSKNIDGPTAGQKTQDQAKKPQTCSAGDLADEFRTPGRLI